MSSPWELKVFPRAGSSMRISSGATPQWGLLWLLFLGMRLSGTLSGLPLPCWFFHLIFFSAYTLGLLFHIFFSRLYWSVCCHYIPSLLSPSAANPVRVCQIKWSAYLAWCLVGIQCPVNHQGHQGSQTNNGEWERGVESVEGKPQVSTVFMFPRPWEAQQLQSAT